MRFIPRMEKCCACYSLKTGSFTIAFMLLVGSAVQTGYYGYLINHSNPRKICDEYFYTYERKFVDEVLPDDELAVRWPSFISPYDYYVDWLGSRRGRSIPKPDNVQEEPERNRENNTSVEKQKSNSTATPTADPVTDTTLQNTPMTPEAPKRTNSRQKTYNGKWVIRRTKHTYQEPCKKPWRMPFDIDVHYLNFDYSGYFKKDILYLNLCLFGAMMCFTPLLMFAVYKESRRLLLCWLVLETTLLSGAAAGTVAASVSMFKVLQVSVGVVTLVNMAFHLAIDIYYVIAVINFHEQLENKHNDDTEEIRL